MWPLLGLVRRHPWVVNVAAYGTLFSAADVAQQVLARPHLDASEQGYLDLKQTGKVALVGFSFHANFNYFWFRSLERLLPGTNVARVIAKVTCDQAIAAPLTIGAFYAGLSLLDGESDIFGNLREKFWPTYKTGVLCWTLFQTVNFTLVPPVLRTAYVGACSFLWTAFLCYLRQNDAHDTTSRMFQALPGLAGFFPSTRNENGVNMPSER
ncbi:mpv17-like protein [Eublepharis macularius]|uniref:Mpv17-like protein n=1 Tax=Eublepharis macularius TaxID=481883 RepID=A0AA97K9G3_EUBMA|nr:mpv17-like protein [Eublepharis macularius]XP_054851377.1 mpv17-like protein [Eublepharis macularius]